MILPLGGFFMRGQDMPRLKAYIMPFVVTIVLGLAFFLLAGTLKFWEAWIYLTYFFAITLFMVIYFAKKNPELLTSRSEFKDKSKAREIPPFLNLFLLVYVVPGLDFRFGWSAVSVWMIIGANIIVCLAYILILIVFNENSYASAVVKLENEQNVISTGPYAIIRHPMYAGMMLMTLLTPLALGSYWAYIPCIFFLPWLYLRTKNEEVLLLEGLEGYRDYSKKVKYRIIPFVW